MHELTKKLNFNGDCVTNDSIITDWLEGRAHRLHDDMIHGHKKSFSDILGLNPKEPEAKVSYSKPYSLADMESWRPVGPQAKKCVHNLDAALCCDFGCRSEAKATPAPVEGKECDQKHEDWANADWGYCARCGGGVTKPAKDETLEALFMMPDIYTEINPHSVHGRQRLPIDIARKLAEIARKFYEKERA